MIPYSNRVWKQGKFHFIQPFADIQGDLSNVDLYLDNNAFIELTHDRGLLDGVINIPGVHSYTLNPAIAFIEQWISNKIFRQAVETDTYQLGMIDRFIAIADGRGQAFAPNYARDITALCEEKEQDFRETVGVLFAYIAVIRSLQRRKMPLDQRISIFKSVLAGDVPTFSGLIGLAAVTFYVLANRQATDDTGAQLISPIESFFAPKGGEPEALSPEYLRNRAMDLWTWYLMPNFLKATAKVNATVPAPIVVTADKFLASVPFRFMPPCRVQGQNSAIALIFATDGLSGIDNRHRLIHTFKTLCPPPRRGSFPVNRKMALLENLNRAVTSILSHEDQAGFEAGLQWATR